MRINPISPISSVNRDGQKLTEERVLEYKKEFSIDSDSSTVVELNTLSELPAFLYDKTGKIK